MARAMAICIFLSGAPSYQVLPLRWWFSVLAGWATVFARRVRPPQSRVGRGCCWATPRQFVRRAVLPVILRAMPRGSTCNETDKPSPSGSDLIISQPSYRLSALATEIDARFYAASIGMSVRRATVARAVRRGYTVTSIRPTF